MVFQTSVSNFVTLHRVLSQDSQSHEFDVRQVKCNLFEFHLVSLHTRAIVWFFLAQLALEVFLYEKLTVCQSAARLEVTKTEPGLTIKIANKSYSS